MLSVIVTILVLVVVVATATYFVLYVAYRLWHALGRHTRGQDVGERREDH